MADTRAASGLTVQQWNDRFFTEYFQENLFRNEMGTSTNSVIQVNEDLRSKKGESVTFALTNRLTGEGVSGVETMVGNEEALQTRSFKLDIIERGNAVVVPSQDEQFSAISLRQAARGALMDWAQENTRDRIIDAMASINGVNYGDATEVQKDAWLVDNADRVLFGDAKANNASNDHSAALGAVTAAMTLGSAELSLMKRIALTANPKIRPMRSASSGRRYYVAYAHPFTFRDLKSDSTIQQAQRDVGIIAQNEKLFQGGDIMWDGVIVKELDDMTLLEGVGDSGIDLAPVFFCGAQALGYGINRRWESRQRKEDDYGRKFGIGIFEMGNFAKLRFGTGEGDTTDPKDHGMVTGYFPAVADS